MKPRRLPFVNIDNTELKKSIFKPKIANWLN